MLTVGRKEETRRQTTRVSARAFAAGREALAAGDYDLARAAFRWARRADPGNPLYIHGEAVVAEQTGNAWEAENLYRRVLDMAVRAFGIGDPRTALIVRDLVELYEEQGRHDEAWMLSAHTINRLDREAAARSGIRVLGCLAEICARSGRLDCAKDLYRDAISLRSEIYGKDSRKVEECLRAIAVLEGLPENNGAATDGTRTENGPGLVPPPADSAKPQSDWLN